jgi:hypothetical protein
MTTLATPTSLGNGARIRGGLLANAYPLPDGWENGITFLGTGCSEPEVSGPCTITDRTEVRPGEASIFEPIFINQSSGCSMLSKVGNVDIAANRLEATTEWALGRALATGAGDNPALVDGESVAVSTDWVEAISCLEQAAADLGFGAEVFLHAPLRAAAYLMANDCIADGWFSPSGFQWIFSPGYPTDPAAITVWATGSVFAGVNPAETLVDGVTGQPPAGWRQNTAAAYRQRLGLAAFDPCLNLSATVTVTACTGGS